METFWKTCLRSRLGGRPYHTIQTSGLPVAETTNDKSGPGLDFGARLHAPCSSQRRTVWPLIFSRMAAPNADEAALLIFRRKAITQEPLPVICPVLLESATKASHDEGLTRLPFLAKGVPCLDRPSTRFSTLPLADWSMQKNGAAEEAPQLYSTTRT